MIVGSAVGGGYDLYARALARELGKHIPGEPSIIVQNQPGAAGMVMVNQIYNQGPHDGTVIGASLNGIPTASMLQTGAKFDPVKLNWLGSLNREAYVAYVWHTAPISHISDLKKQEILVGATTAGTTMVDYPLLLNDLLGYKFKVVRGYQGPPQINLAIERGEVQGNGGLGYAVVQALTQRWLDEKKIKILVQYNFQGVPELQGRSPGDRACDQRARTPGDAAGVCAFGIFPAILCLTGGAEGTCDGFAPRLRCDGKGSGVPRRSQEAAARYFGHAG